MDEGVQYQHMHMGRVTGLVGIVPFRIEWNRQGRDAASLTIHYMDKGVSYASMLEYSMMDCMFSRYIYPANGS